MTLRRAYIVDRAGVLSENLHLGPANFAAWPSVTRALLASLLAFCALEATPVKAAPLTPELEYIEALNVGTTFITVPLTNTYANAIPVCTYVLASPTDRSAVPRIRNITPSSFQLRIQEFTGGANPTASTTPGTVFCVVAEAGAHTLPDGRLFEAFSVVSDETSGLAFGWNIAADAENVSALVSQSYANPVTMGAVISANDPQPSAIWATDCDARGNAPFDTGQGDGICVGKQVGQINQTRVDETIGVIIAEAGAGIANGISYLFQSGPNSINGVSSNFNTSYAIAGDFEAAVAMMTGVNGNQGGWAVLTGGDPLPANAIRLSIDEEVVAGDTGRSHIDEEVTYFAFRDDRFVNFTTQKSVELFGPGNIGGLALPGNDVAYTLRVQNSGNSPPDEDSIFIVDPLPPEVAFFNGDFDPGDADTAAILFVDSGSGLTFDVTNDARFSNGASPPASFAACTYSPASGYDANVRFICLNPKGRFLGAATGLEAEFRFRARIE